MNGIQLYSTNEVEENNLNPHGPPTPPVEKESPVNISLAHTGVRVTPQSKG